MKNTLRHAIVVVALCFAHLTPGNALTPLTPRLTNESRTQLLQELTKVGFPEVGQNSVLIVMGDVLGFEPKANSSRYREPYPHLPKVDAQAEPTASDCARVTLLATLEAQALRVQVIGTYCLAGPALWRSVEQTVRRE